MQKKWKTDRKAFDSFRQLMENKNILVIQAFEIETSIMRGFSLSFSPFPVIVVNHNDSFTGRSFTLFHEFAHIATNTSGLCNESGSSKIEVICNQIAAEVLMPKDVFIESVKEIFNSVVELGWDDYYIENLAKDFGVSREAIVRRLLTFKFVSQEFYEEKRKEYQAEFDRDKTLKIEAIKNMESKKGPMGLCKGTVIYARVRNGSSIPDIIMDAYFAKKISFVEASKILQLKSKNFNKLVNQYI
jgi:Zn-dependent peptidase ImmA (M78 family)